MATYSIENGSKYDVFISFRGADIRDTFLSHLLAAFKAQRINVFIDTELERGVEISLGLSKAIEESKIALIIFSRDYASSSWCLDELVMIMERRITHKKRVIPIFYQVDPIDVENQIGSYEEAFTKHVKKLEYKEKVVKWRQALRDASYIAGWDSKNIRPDAVLVEAIVEGIAKILKQEFFDNNVSNGTLTRSEDQQNLLQSINRDNQHLCLCFEREPDMNKSILFIYI